MASTAAVSSRPQYAPEDPTLPKPWRGLVDGNTGYLYFWNPETNVTTYERPKSVIPKEEPPSDPVNSSEPVNSSDAVNSSVPVNSSDQVQQSLEEQTYEQAPYKEDDSNGRGSNGGSDDGLGDHQSARASAADSNDEKGIASVGLRAPSTASNVSAEAYRKQHEITVSGSSVPPPLTSFEVTGFPSELLRAVHAAGFKAPTPIQAQSWPIALQGRDIVAIAKTGSGKTLGYLIPGFAHLKKRGNNSRMGPTVLVLSPTRELATQIQDEAIKFGKCCQISCTCLYGGAPKGPQLKDLDRGVDIVVATPGRLNDILEMKRVYLHQVSYLVLDEADRMLDMGFEPQIRKIVNEVPARRQTLMYTATWPKEVRKIAADLLVNPVQVNIGNVDELVANKNITQHVEVLQYGEKHRRLEQILQSQEPGSKVIIFCSTKKMCDQLARNLSRHVGSAAIHGDKSQAERDSVLSDFRSGRSPILVATDVAARGLDVKDVRVVVNYDFPTGVEDYVHRIGRTGRAGASGIAYTFFGDNDAKYASDLIKILEGANQKVPQELRSMSSRGGGGGGFRRWGSDSGGGRGGRGDSGYGGGRGGSESYGGRSGGRGGYNSDWNGGGEQKSSGGGWGNRDRSRSPERFDQNQSGSGPVKSFHQLMMEKSRASN